MANYVEGYVYDETGMGAIGIPVVLKGTTTGTSTDADGYYKIVPLSTTQMNTGILVVSYVGYKTVEVSIQNRSYLDIQLELEDESVDPEPERLVLPSNKIATIQNIVDFLTGGDKTSFYNDAVSRGYTATKCPPIWIVDAIIQSTNVSLSIPSFTNSTKNKLVKYSDLAEGTFSISPTSKSLTSSAQTFAVSVTNTTGKIYFVSSNVSWITVYNNSPNISVSANTSTSSRYGTVTFTCNGMSRTVSITQSGSSSTYSIPIYYVQKGWCDEEDFEIDARLSASFTGSYSATICNKLAITDGWGQSGRGDSKSIINTFNISASQLSNTYLNFWGYDNNKQEGRVYVVKVSADGERELVSSILYLEEFGGSSVSPSIRIWMSNVQQGDSFEIWFEQGDTTYGIDNSLQ